MQKDMQERVADGIRAVEALRIAGLAQAAAMQEAKAGVMRREVARTTAKHGSESPDTKRAAERLEMHERLHSELELEVGLAKRPAARPEKGALVLEGHVLDEAFSPVEDAIASAVREDGESIAEERTDARGHFRLTVPAARVAMKAEQRDVVDDSGSGARVRLEITLEKGGEVLYRDEFAQAPKADDVVYRRVILGRRESPRAARA